VSTVEEGLNLTHDEVAIIDIRIHLGDEIQALPRTKGLSADEGAEILGTSLAQVANLEKDEATLDQLAQSSLGLGGSADEVGRRFLDDSRLSSGQRGRCPTRASETSPR